jgi:hypothetical protein
VNIGDVHQCLIAIVSISQVAKSASSGVSKIMCYWHSRYSPPSGPITQVTKSKKYIQTQSTVGVLVVNVPTLLAQSNPHLARPIQSLAGKNVSFYISQLSKDSRMDILDIQLTARGATKLVMLLNINLALIALQAEVINVRMPLMGEELLCVFMLSFADLAEALWVCIGFVPL